MHAAKLISKWIKEQVEKPVIIGPDSESQQWVSEVAKYSDVPYMVLSKIRKGHSTVEISVPEIENYKDHTPVLVDDIISTAGTMIETVKHLNTAKMKPAICIAVHGIFVDNAYQNLLDVGVEKVITCNTIQHVSNDIDVTELIAEKIKNDFS